MTFAPGKSGNPAGRAPKQLLLSAVARDVRRSTIRIVGARAPELIELGVKRALAGNDLALAGCLQILAAMAADTTAKPSSISSAATDSQRPGIMAD
jgi:hypothetical protein